MSLLSPRQQVIHVFGIFTLRLFTLVDVSPSMSTVDVCLGDVRRFTCNITGASLLVWGYPGVLGTTFTSTDNETRRIGDDIEVEAVSTIGDVLSVRATVNVTQDINGNTLQCRDSFGASGSNTRDITFNVQSK